MADYKPVPAFSSYSDSNADPIVLELHNLQQLASKITKSRLYPSQLLIYILNTAYQTYGAFEYMVFIRGHYYKAYKEYLLFLLESMPLFGTVNITRSRYTTYYAYGVRDHTVKAAILAPDWKKIALYCEELLAKPDLVEKADIISQASLKKFHTSVLNLGVSSK